MSERNDALRSFMAFYIWVVLLLLLEVVDINGQRRPTEIVLEMTARNVTELQQRLSAIQSNQTLFIDIEELHLTEPIVLNTSGIVIRGRGIEETTILCSDALRQGAFIIREGSIRMSDFTIAHCHRDSAVVVETEDSIRFDRRNVTSIFDMREVASRSERENATSIFDSREVTFYNVAFRQNGERKQGIRGGAVRSADCPEQSCIHRRLTFQFCTFSQNRGMSGGALFLENTGLIVENSVFTDNDADLTGGAIYINNRWRALVLIKASSFENNKAFGDKDVHHLEPSSLLRLSNETIAAYGLGGAIYAFRPHRLTIDASTFMYNTGCQGGGAIAIAKAALDVAHNVQTSFHLSNSHFDGNQAYCGTQRDALIFALAVRNPHRGGALLYEHLDDTYVEWATSNSTFVRNSARMGGGFTVQSSVIESSGVPPFAHNIFSCFFDENTGLVSAGGFSVLSVRLNMTNTTVRNCAAVYGGGILAMREAVFRSLPHPTDPEALNIVEGNRAIYAGGVYSDTGGNVELSAIVIRNNTAFRYGGGFRTVDVDASVVMRGVIIEGNKALAGGGIAILALTSLTITDDNGKPSIIRDNIAAVGGGVYYEPGHSIFLSITINNTHFTKNRALSLISPEMEDLVETGTVYQPLPSLNVRMPDIEEQLGEFSLFSFLTEMSEGHGGGIGITLVDVRLFTVIGIIFQNLLITENEAMVGGGISAHMTDLYWNRGDQRSCESVALGLDTCQRFVLHNVTVVKNRADYAGGIFTTFPEGIATSCGPDNSPNVKSADLVKQYENTKALTAYCSNISANEISDGLDIEGADGGSNAAFFAVEGLEEGEPLKQVASGERLALRCEDGADASCERPLRIAVKDVFGQTILRGIKDAGLTLSLLSNDIVGDLRYTAVDGIAVINNTMAWGVGTSSNVTIVSDNHPEISLQLKFTTRQCYPGELLQDNVCRKCPSEQYGFHPKLKGCTGCEENAKCLGGAALVPSNGYWHSSPFSPLMHECIYPDACKYEGREEILTEFYEDAARLNEDITAMNLHIEGRGPKPHFPEYRQCAEGYEGVLCESCQDGYGHSHTGTCEKCPGNGATNGIFIFLGTLWLFLLIGANCSVTLFSKNCRVQLVKHELQCVTQTRRLRRAPPIALDANRSRRTHRLIKQPSRESSSELQRLDSNFRGILVRQLIATVQLTETLKIFINYAQVTSAALHLQINWNSLLHGLLSTEAGFLGLSDEIMKAPFECNFKDDAATPASISALWIRLALPWIILIALCFFFSVFWCIGYVLRRRRRSLGHTASFDQKQLFTCLVIISVVSMYFSYIDVVRQLLRSVNCVEIGEESGQILSDHPYGRYVIERQEKRVWAEDTDVICYEGRHLPIGIVGIVGLFISFCGIITIIVWLPLNRKHVTNTEFVSRYWFLYQAYRKEWYTNAWESTILARKSLIAAVVVFSVHLGPTLQASLCTGILVLAYIMHSFLTPFKIPDNHEYLPEYAGGIFKALHMPKLGNWWVSFNNAVHLNNLESASLASSIVFFFSAIILDDSSSTALGCSSMVAFTFVVNVVFLMYIVYRLYAGMHVLLDLKLEMSSSSFLATHEPSMSILTFVRKAVELLHVARSQREEELNENQEDNQTTDATDDEQMEAVSP